MAGELYHRFNASPQWGKEPEALASMTFLMTRDLAHYPAELILKAIATHCSRTDEMPTVADINGLIRRNGRAPIKESEVIAIRRKDGADRSQKDWDTLKAWEREQREEWDDPAKQRREAEENARLRQHAARLEAENQRLAGLLRQSQQAAQLPQERTMDERVANTIAQMQADGRTSQEIEEFKISVGA